MIVQGAESNHTGSRLERYIESEFRSRGVEVFEHSMAGDNADLFARRFLAKRVPYTTVYGCQGKSEFVFKDYFETGNIRIECRWQEEQGSVDEKFPYFLENAKLVTEREVWLVVDGGGAKPQAVAWLKREARRVSTKSIKVLTLQEALSEIKRLLTAPAGRAA